MANFTPIAEPEMRNFLQQQGFAEIPLADTNEIVYGKRFGELSLRVYTSVVKTISRGVGEDAIRVTVFYRDPSKEIHKVGGSKRVHRVEGWRKNLQKRIDGWDAALPMVRCPHCSAPMITREVKKKDSRAYGQSFLSCCTWAKTKCPGTIWGTPK